MTIIGSRVEVLVAACMRRRPAKPSVALCIILSAMGIEVDHPDMYMWLMSTTAFKIGAT